MNEEEKKNEGSEANMGDPTGTRFQRLINHRVCQTGESERREEEKGWVCMYVCSKFGMGGNEK